MTTLEEKELEEKEKAAGRVFPVQRLVGELCAMHNTAKKIGWMEQHTLHQAVKLLNDLRAELEWYAANAEAMARHVLAHNTKAMMETMQVLALDGGKRAEALLRPNAQGQPTA